MPSPAVLFAFTALVAQGIPVLQGVELAQLTIRERVIIRVRRMAAPVISDRRAPLPRPVRWKEKHGPKCLAPAHVVGAMVSTPTTVDLVQDNGARMRAKLDRDCDALSYYANFYIRPGADGLICADRDAIRTRSGGSCTIAKFRVLRLEH